MTRVGHVFDDSTGWEQRVAVSQLIERLPEADYDHRLIVVHPAGAAVLRELDRSLTRVPRLGGLHSLAGPLLRGVLDRSRADVVHAWGLHAASTARMSGGTPLVVELFDPHFTPRHLKLIRALARPRGFAVICSSETVRRRLVEGGVPVDLCVVIRPGVDFALINHHRRGGTRQALGIAPTDLVVIVPEPAQRIGGQFEAFWGVALASYVLPGVRIVVTGETREVARIRRYAAAHPRGEVLIAPGRKYPFEQLIAIADVLVVATPGDASTTAIAWAMAGEAAVIGAAGYAVAELIANKVNGLLFKPPASERNAVAIVRLLRDRVSQEKAREVARGQAYEAFGIRRNIEQHSRLYENVLRGEVPGKGLTD